MIISSLQLKNFRRFEKFSIDFHENITVIVARNGQGKTTTLDAATIALGTFIGAFDLGKARHIERSDALYHRLTNSPENEQKYPVEIEACFNNPDISIKRELTGAKNKSTIKGAQPLTDYGKGLQAQIRNLETVNLPVIAFYGSGRLWQSHKNVERKSVLSESRTMGYEDCLSPSSNFKQVQQWLSKATLAVLQMKNIPEYKSYNLEARIRGIQNTVDYVLANEGWGQFHYSLIHEELAMSHDDHGILPVSLLSDGVRAMVSLTADLAFRCSRLNGHLGEQASAQTQGIVFIDEVDLHLHPAWQQTVIATLMGAFPAIQFIVTTHSAQVLSTVPNESIRVLTTDKQNATEGIVKTPDWQTQGVSSANILAEIMYRDPVPDLPASRLLSQYKTLIEVDDIDSAMAKQIRSDLTQHFGENHPEMNECDRLIRLRAFKKRIVKAKKESDNDAQTD